VSAARSAGILLYRVRQGELEVLLGHPGGPYYDRRPDEGAWSIPKGEPGGAETDLEATARREFAEETGTAISGPLASLGSIVQRGGKEVHAWAVSGDLDPAMSHSNLFTLEWPPHSGVTASFPEIDRVAWFGLAEARRKLREAQTPFLERLELLVRP